MVISRGQRVAHRRYGEGKVTEKRHGGYEVMVHLIWFPGFHSCSSWMGALF